MLADWKHSAYQGSKHPVKSQETRLQSSNRSRIHQHLSLHMSKSNSSLHLSDAIETRFLHDVEHLVHFE